MPSVSPTHKGWLRNFQSGLLGATYVGASPGAVALAANTALTNFFLGTPVVPAIAVDTIVITNLVASGDIVIAANAGGNSQAWLWVDSSAGTLNLFGAGTAIAIISATVFEVEDGIIFALGNDQDDAFVHRTTTLGANTALTGVIEGTPVSQAVAANSLLIGNITDDGDIALYVSVTGNSEQVVFADASARVLYFGQTSWALNMLNGAVKFTLGTVSAFATTQPTNAMVFRQGTAPAGAITTAAGIYSDGTLLNKIIADGTTSNIAT